MTLLLLSACLETPEKDSAEPAGDPDVALTPAAVDFGDVPVGEYAAATVNVQNLGDGDLALTSLELEGTDGGYALSALSDVLVPPGGASAFVVTFTPASAGDATAFVLVASDDPDEPEVEVALTGTGVAPSLSVSPEVYDFGTVYVGCEAVTPVTLGNDGNADLVVDDLSFVTASNDLALDDDEAVNGALPWTLAPGQYATVYVGYAPLDDFADEGFLVVSSDDPLTPQATASQTGLGALYGENLDVFVQPDSSTVDVLVAWDSTMDEVSTSARANLEDFVSALAGSGVDYQLAVVTDDDGCVNGARPYVDGTMALPDQLAAVGDMVDAGTHGLYAEAGFTLLEAATTSSNLASGGCNEGLLRAGTQLALVGVSDEAEQSPNPWSYYVTLLGALADDVVFHAVAGDYPSGCADADAGTGWYEAAVSTGGSFLSVCSTDWGADLDLGRALDLDTFELTGWPVPETVAVTVDGVAVSSGWTYDTTDNTVAFDTAPEGGATVEIRYALFGECSS